MFCFALNFPKYNSFNTLGGGASAPHLKNQIHHTLCGELKNFQKFINIFLYVKKTAKFLHVLFICKKNAKIFTHKFIKIKEVFI
jgi:hypothetical protein